METPFENLKNEKTKEAEEFFHKIGINIIPVVDTYNCELPNFSENSNQNKTDDKFHWTRLSINSDAGFKIK